MAYYRIGINNNFKSFTKLHMKKPEELIEEILAAKDLDGAKEVIQDALNDAFTSGSELVMSLVSSELARAEGNKIFNDFMDMALGGGIRGKMTDPMSNEN